MNQKNKAGVGREGGIPLAEFRKKGLGSPASKQSSKQASSNSNSNSKQSWMNPSQE